MIFNEYLLLIVVKLMVIEYLLCIGLQVPDFTDDETEAWGG